jgi:1-acyl-sn-glycerol-3-phosphate acyltransferase
VTERSSSEARLAPARAEEERADLLTRGRGRLSIIERAQIRFVRRTFEPGAVDRVIRLCQRHVGASWIHHCTKHLRHVYGFERLPRFSRESSFVLVSNHRSFFDLYVIMAELMRRGLPHRIVFPVRSQFFYTSPVGLFVNGVMSFFAMYPPIFRERRRLALNAASLDELVALLRRGGVFAGIHPEGTRKRDDDPYTLLPAQRGVGRLVHGARVPVIPVFINGLINDLPRQIGSNFDRTGRKIIVVFGAPLELQELWDAPASPRTYQQIADRTLDAVRALGQEEKRLREALELERAACTA